MREGPESLGLTRWIQKLTERFAPSQPEAFNKLLREHYTHASVREGRRINECVMTVMRVAEMTGTKSRSMQMLAAWLQIDPLLF